MDYEDGWVFITGIYLEAGAVAPRSAVMERLASYPNFARHAVQVEALLSIMDQCRPWLTRACAGQLTEAAYRHNDAIAQQLEFYSFNVVPDQVRTFAAPCEASDMEAIAAFVLTCAAHALEAISPILQSERTDAVAHLELYSVHFETIWPVWECATSTRLTLDAEEIDACHQIAALASDASGRAWHKLEGYWGERERRSLHGSDARDALIINKAFDLLKTGTHRRNLSSKLREWQLRQTGKALSKPAMDTVLKEFNRELLTYSVNLLKK